MCRSPSHLSCEREAAVFGELLEHVIEETDAGARWYRRGVSRFTVDVDVGLLGRAPDRRPCAP